MARLLARAIRTHRRRLSQIVLVVVVVAIGLQFHSALPQETSVNVVLGTDHDQVTDLRMAYVQDGQVYHGAHFRYPAGAPSRVHHRVDLATGKYTLECDVMRRDGTQQHVTRGLSVPVEGQLRLQIAP